MNSVVNKILHIFYIALFLVIYFCVAQRYLEQGFDYYVIGGLVLCGIAVAIYAFLRKHKGMITEKRLRNIFIIAQAVMLVIQIIIVLKLGYTPTSDVGYVDNAARNFASSGNFDTINIINGEKRFYFSRYPNNWGILITLSLIYRLFYVVLGFVPAYLSCALNIFCIQLSGFLLYRLSKMIFKGTTKPLFCVILFAVHPAFYINAPLFYTDVLSMPFVLGAVILFIKAVRAEHFKNFALYLFLCGIVTAFGYSFKGSLGVLAVAFVIYSLLKCGWKKCLCVVAVLVVCIPAVSKSIRYTGLKMEISNTKLLEKYEMPVTHWANMALSYSTKGHFNREDTKWLLQFKTYDERNTQAINSIKEKLKNYPIDKLAEHTCTKITTTWSNGMYYGEYLNECNNSSLKYFLTEGKTVTTYTQSLHFCMLTLYLLSLFYGVYHTKLKEGVLIKLIVFGVGLFFVVWEIKARYILNILPLLIIGCASGLDYLNALWSKAKVKLDAVPEEAKLKSKVKRQRIEWVDILRGAMMFFVVYGHSTARGDVSRYIFSFHMPVFFVISGMTFAFNREYNFTKYLIKKVKNLLLPYFLLNLYVSPLWFWNRATGANSHVSALGLIKGIFISNVDSGYPMASNTTWFITCLFLTDILFFVIRKFCRSDKSLVLGVLAITSTAYAFGIVKLKGGGIWHWQVTATSIVFFLCGYLFMKNISAIREYMLKSKARTYALIVLFIVNGYMMSNLNGRVSMVNDSYKNIFYFYMSAIFTSLAVTMIIMLLCEHKKAVKLLAPINFIGQTTLAYIAFHVPIIKLLKHYTSLGDKSEIKRFTMAVIIYVGLMPVAWVVKRILPGGFKLWIKNKKEQS